MSDDTVSRTVGGVVADATNETISRLADIAQELAAQARFALRGCVVLAPVEIKAALGTVSYRLITSLDAVRKRLSELQAACAFAWPLHDEAAAIHSLDVLVSRLGGVLDRLQTTDACQAVMDAPTHEALSHIRSQIEMARFTLQTLPEMAIKECALTDINMLPWMPARDARFRLKSAGDKPARPATSEDKLVVIYHGLLMSTEIPTIEACADLVLSFPEQPWEFTVDMSRQIWDEARHAVLMMARLHALGGALGQYPVDLSMWRLCVDKPLDVRLAIHQRIGEWTGVDAALHFAEQLDRAGFREDAAIWSFIAIDEIQHVHGGNKWLSRLHPDERARRRTDELAERMRSDAGMLAHTFPFHAWACEASGFAPREVEHLREIATRNLMVGDAWTLAKSP